jgi:response regulator RpfG family c-di-GMP phosphodiesterase
MGGREVILALRDDILRLQGYDVVSATSLAEGPRLFAERPFDLVLVDVEGQGRVPEAEALCAVIRTLHPGQRIAFVWNYLVSIESDCPDDIIQAQFNPQAFIEGVARMLE